VTNYQLLKEYYSTHDMRFDGLTRYGYMDDYATDDRHKCRVCKEFLDTTYVIRGAVCTECRLTGGYNSERYVG